MGIRISFSMRIRAIKRYQFVKMVLNINDNVRVGVFIDRYCRSSMLRINVTDPFLYPGAFHDGLHLRRDIDKFNPFFREHVNLFHKYFFLKRTVKNHLVFFKLTKETLNIVGDINKLT